jgi:hypothetical protein
MKFSSANAQAMGRKGGNATLAAHGREHFRTIGKKGFQVTTDRHFDGDRRKHLNFLISRGLACMDPCPWNRVWQNFQAFPDPVEE